MSKLLAAVLGAAVVCGVAGAWAFSQLSESAGAEPACPGNPNPPPRCRATPTATATSSPTETPTPSPSPTSIPGLKDIEVRIADTFDPIEIGLPVTYEIIARNIGDTAGDAEVVFTPGVGFTQLDFGWVNAAHCNIGGEPNGGSSCNQKPTPWRFDGDHRH